MKIHKFGSTVLTQFCNALQGAAGCSERKKTPCWSSLLLLGTFLLGTTIMTCVNSMTQHWIQYKTSIRQVTTLTSYVWTPLSFLLKLTCLMPWEYPLSHKYLFCVPFIHIYAQFQLYARVYPTKCPVRVTVFRLTFFCVCSCFPRRPSSRLPSSTSPSRWHFELHVEFDNVFNLSKSFVFYLYVILLYRTRLFPSKLIPNRTINITRIHWLIS